MIFAFFFCWGKFIVFQARSGIIKGNENLDELQGLCGKEKQKNDEMKEELKRITFGKAKKKKKNEMKKQKGNKQRKPKGNGRSEKEISKQSWGGGERK